MEIEDIKKASATHTFQGRLVDLSSDVPKNVIRIHPETYYNLLNDMGCLDRLYQTGGE